LRSPMRLITIWNLKVAQAIENIIFWLKNSLCVHFFCWYIYFFEGIYFFVVVVVWLVI
jgi:hypothetical protein